MTAIGIPQNRTVNLTCAINPGENVTVRCYKWLIDDTVLGTAESASFNTNCYNIGTHIITLYVENSCGNNLTISQEINIIKNIVQIEQTDNIMVNTLPTKSITITLRQEPDVTIKVIDQQ